MYAIRLTMDAVTELRALSAYYRQIIISAIETRLTHEPTVPSRQRKCLPNLTHTWDTVRPIWELRVRGYRVFYDVSDEDRIVIIRAIGHKPPEKRTEDIL